MSSSQQWQHFPFFLPLQMSLKWHSNVSILRPPASHRQDKPSAVACRCSAVVRTPQWTHAFPRGCSRRTAWRSRGDGIPRTRPRASPRCWAGARARWDRPGRSGSSSGWPQTWTGRSRGVLWSASPLPLRLLFAKVEGKKAQNPGKKHHKTLLKKTPTNQTNKKQRKTTPNKQNQTMFFSFT